MSNNVIIQNVLFPEWEEFKPYADLFYHGAECVVTGEHTLLIPKGISLDFATYLNGVPLNKWKKYTNIDNITLVIRIKGSCRLTLTGYTLGPEYPVRKVLASENMEGDSAHQQSLSFQMNQEAAFLGFEIDALSTCELFDAHFETRRDSVNDINLLISTTTCRKEEYIKNNVARLRSSILESEDEMKEHFYINVVDNGKTLKREEIESPHVRLIPNNNTGGSGGFARGMLEALHMEKEKITHVLLMDDDVLVFPESIRRTYELLRLCKPKYQRAILCGAMMEIDHMSIMHEDIGTLLPNKDFFHVKPIRDEKFLYDVMQTNREYPRVGHDYCGWWYCCIPISVIRKNGLPLPLFIRGDDVEYGIRCGGPFMTMSGICVWHMGFANKYSNATNLYQEFRNIFIVKDTTGNIDDVDMMKRWNGEILRTLITYNYKGTEALLAAMEDYLKGPAFIEEDHSVELLKRNKKFNETFTPLGETEPTGVIIERVGEDSNIPLPKKVLYFWTLNGQRAYLGEMNSVPGIMTYEFGHQPGHTAFHSRILAVNRIDNTACLRVLDKKKFSYLWHQYQKLLRRYLKEHEKVRKAYHHDFKKMTSEAFWRSYLKLDSTGRSSD